jgi:hypothetical protein
MFILGITLWLILNRASIYENMSFCYDTIYVKVSFCRCSLRALGISLWLMLHRTSIYKNMLFCYDTMYDKASLCYRTIYDKVSFCYRSLKGYGKACFDKHCFACFYRFKERFLRCRCRRPSAHDGSVSSDESSEVTAGASQSSMHGVTNDLL